MTHDLLNLGETELCDAYFRGTLSPVEVTRAYLNRIATYNRRQHAYLDVYAEGALLQAQASEKRLTSGLPVGLLEGIPLVLNDLLHIASHRTTAGSTIHVQSGYSTTTATVATRLLGAGAVVLGKTNLVEFAFGGWGTNAGTHSPHNPWNAKVSRSAGGSSSGSAVAVAAGLAAAAIGTDTGGSVRIPSAFCGLTGLKTTQGRVSNYGFELVSPTLDTVGPMAWSAEDAALLLQAMHGPDPQDSTTLAQTPEDFLLQLRELIRGLRLSIAHSTTLGHVEPCISAAVKEAVRVLQSLGCLRHEEAFSGLDFVTDQTETGVIISSEACAAPGHLLAGQPPAGDIASRVRVMSGATVSSQRYIAALRTRQQRQREFAKSFERSDLLVLPTLPVTAKPLSSLARDDPSPSRLTRFVGYYGLCAIALPCGLSPLRLFKKVCCYGSTQPFNQLQASTGSGPPLTETP